MAGNGTIGLEILEDLPDPDAVVIPYGGGGLTVGIASAIKALRPQTKIYRRRAGDGRRAARCARGRDPDRGRLPAVVRRRRRQPPRARHDVAAGRGRSSTPRSPVPIADAAAAVRMIAERARVIAEGAGALATAAALAGRAGGGKVVCIVSGGNINLAKVAEIMSGGEG